MYDSGTPASTLIGAIPPFLLCYSGLHLYEEAVLGFPLPLRERDRVRGKAGATHLLIQTKSAVKPALSRVASVTPSADQAERSAHGCNQSPTQSVLEQGNSRLQSPLREI